MEKVKEAEMIPAPDCSVILNESLVLSEDLDLKVNDENGGLNLSVNEVEQLRSVIAEMSLKHPESTAALDDIDITIDDN